MADEDVDLAEEDEEEALAGDRAIARVSTPPEAKHPSLCGGFCFDFSNRPFCFEMYLLTPIFLYLFIGFPGFNCRYNKHTPCTDSKI